MPLKYLALVRDDPDDEGLTTRALYSERLANNIDDIDDIVVARDDAEAVEILLGLRARPELLMPALLELKLPKLNGLEVLPGRRSDKRTRSAPAAVQTASSQAAVKQPSLYWMLLNHAPPRI
jgi:CheY-like chemotaxis protein